MFAFNHVVYSDSYIFAHDKTAVLSWYMQTFEQVLWVWLNYHKTNFVQCKNVSDMNTDHKGSHNHFIW